VRGDQWGVVVGLYITETGQGRELEPVLRSIAKKHEAGLALGGLEVSQKRGSKRQRVAALRKVRHAGCHCEDSRLQKKKAPPPARLVAQGFVDTLPTDHDRPGHKARSVVDITPARAVRLAALVACLQDRAAFGAAQDGACPTSAVARAERPFWHRLHQVAIKAARGTNARFPVKDAFARHRHSTATFCHISNGAERQTRFPRISSTHRTQVDQRPPLVITTLPAHSFKLIIRKVFQLAHPLRVITLHRLHRKGRCAKIQTTIHAGESTLCHGYFFKPYRPQLRLK